MSHDCNAAFSKHLEGITPFTVLIQQFVTAVTSDLGIFTNPLWQNAHREWDLFTLMDKRQLSTGAQRSSRQ
jgi:hypothetical protein